MFEEIKNSIDPLALRAGDNIQLSFHNEIPNFYRERLCDSLSEWIENNYHIQVTVTDVTETLVCRKEIEKLVTW